MPITRNIRSTRQPEERQPTYPGRRINSSATPPSPTSTLPLTVDPIYSPTTPEASSPEVYQRRAKRRSPVSRKSADHIPRPRNAFIIFRSHMYQTLKSDSVQLPGDKHQNQQNELSKMAAKAWKNMEEHERQPFADIALSEKTAHKIKYPHYVYSPGGKPGSGKSKAPKKATSTRRKKLLSPSPSPPPPPPPAPVHYDFPFHHPPRRAAAQRASEKISQMDACTPPSSGSSGSDVQMEIDEDFIPTSEIPPLDLNATVEIENELKYPDLENYLDGYSHNGHYTSSGNFSSDVSAPPYFDFQPHLKYSSEYLLPNSLLPISLSFDGNQTHEIGSHAYNPDDFEVTTGYGDYPLLDADYQSDKPQWGADASVRMFDDYIDYNQFSS